ncbi:AraC family transcriptional regulator [Subtercola endophyticus]|uniref:AraC family transcriptional regulator n=1 Tax=Subtercola endophyticus TaxID=2895559 RepID=UPI001E3AFFAB|nr:helix-turn-helix domain-containing protein [Subtercola endophyticus]UFS59569.1 helix-turn-helix domain-containing protein [Subtercola endophyticus]
MFTEPTPRLTERVDWRLSGQVGLDQAPGHATSPNPEAFHSVGSRWTFGDGLAVSTTLQSPFVVNVGDEAEADAEGIYVVFVRSGAWRLTENGQTFGFRAGEAGFISPTRPVLGQNLSVSTLTTISLPRETISQIGADVPSGVGGFRLSGLRDPSLSFILGVTAAAGETPIPAAPAAALIGQLITGLFLEHQGYRMDSGSVTSGLWARGQALIAAQSGDSDLTPTAIAAQLNVSVRHLQRAYAATGQTLAEAIRARRLDRAVVEITGTHRSFSEIAGRTGFATVAELRRALVAVHSVTARDLRSAGRVPQNEGTGIR